MFSLKNLARKGILSQGLYSLSGKPSYRKILLSKPRDSYLDFFNRSEIWQAHRQQRWRDTY